MCGIVNPDPLRNQAGLGWRTKAVGYALASLIVATGLGGFLGAVGSTIRWDIRLAVAVVGAFLAIGVGSAELAGRSVRLPQLHRETPQGWLALGALRWSILNGAALGCGFASRVGFASWYVVPLSALLGGDPVLGAAIYGTYGGVRGIAPWFYLAIGDALALRLRWRLDEIGVWLLQRHAHARTVGGIHLLATGVALTILLGF